MTPQGAPLVHGLSTASVATGYRAAARMIGTSRALAVFPAQRAVRLIDHPEPRISGPTEVKLRMLEVGVCGTDREICTFQYGTPPADSDYLVLGHESLGQVVEIGPAVRHLRVGDLVVLMVRRPCDKPDCPACRAGRQDFCFTGEYTERGIKGAHGYLTEYVVDDERYIIPVPPSLRDVAVLTEPLTIAEKGLREVGQVQQRLPWGCPIAPGSVVSCRHRALVLGAGPVGLLGALVLADAGFETHVYSRSRELQRRTAFVNQIGGVYLAAETTSLDQAFARIGNVDLIFEAAGASQLAFEALERLGTNGVFVFTGVPGRKAPIQIDADRIMRSLVLRNQVVFGTVNAGRDDFESAIKSLARFQAKWPGAAASLMTGHYPMEQYTDIVMGAMGGIKNVIRIGDEH